MCCKRCQSLSRSCGWWIVGHYAPNGSDLTDVWSCRATFDTDNIDIGPERRNYLDHRLSRVWEMNSEVGTSESGRSPLTYLVR